MSPEQKKPTVSLDDIMQQVESKTIPSLPQKPAEAKPAPDQNGKAFMASDGRMMYEYIVEGEKLITPKPIEEMTLEDFDRMAPTISDPQLGRIPQTLTVKFKDPQWAGHWFNRKAQDGRRISEARALGFVPAKREDCEWIAHSINDEDGAIMDNDLVLMKIHKAVLFAKYKQHMDMARIKGGKDSYKTQAEGSLPNGGADKVAVYYTPQAEREFSGLGPVTHIPTVS